MARNFQVLLGTIGDKDSQSGTGWGVTLPVPISTIPPGATVAEIANSLNLGGEADTIWPGNFDIETAFFDVFVDLWELTGGNPEDGTYAFNNLPAGFQVVTQSLTASVGGGPWDSAVLTALGSGSSNVLTGAGLLTYTYNALQTAFQLGTEKLGVTFIPLQATPHANNILGRVFSLVLSGTYQLLPFQWTLDTTDPVQEGDPIQISSPDVDGLLLDELDEISIQYTDRDGDPQEVIVTPTVEQAHLLIFLFPALPGLDADENINVVAVGNGTQFSGSVILGQLTILIENGSGIYRIISGKSNDTLYVNSAVDDTTADVKIPNPFAKTGFIGG